MPALLDRAVLWLNHVLAAEPAATARLVAHAGRRVTVQWQAPAGPWPRPDDVVLAITPAGLCERVEVDAAGWPDTATGLRVTVPLPAPHEAVALWLDGRRPSVHVEGDAQFAADVAWLAENLRWDAEYDLARWIGDAPAHELMRWGAGFCEAVRGAARGVTDVWGRRPGTRAAAP